MPLSIIIAYPAIDFASSANGSLLLHVVYAGLQRQEKATKMKTSIGIIDSDRQAVVLQLAKLLADEYVLYIKTRNAHWNVEGPDY